MSTPRPSKAASGGHHTIAAAALLATYMQAVNISVPNAALPHIQATLSMANDEVGWVFSSYIAASAVTMSITRWLAARYGRRMIYQVALAIFALGLLLDTLATTSIQFVLTRIVQGAASGPLARGFDVILAEYTLAPIATMTGIVGEIGALLDYLANDPDGIGTAGRPIHLSGHSAGGHLTAVYRAHPAVVSALAISPLVDLEPISLCVLNDKLQLSAREVDAYSPLRHVGPGAPTVVAVGDAELPELVRQARDYATACEAAGERIVHVGLPGMRHFDVLDDLAKPDGAMLAALQSIVPR